MAESQSAVKARKPTKNEQRRAKKKQQKQNGREASVTPAPEAVVDLSVKDSSEPPFVKSAPPGADDTETDDPFDIEVDEAVVGGSFSEFKDILAKFNEQEEDVTEPKKPEVFYDDDENIQDEDEEKETKERLSKKERKKANKLSIAELKAIVRKPEIVDWTDVSAQDPKLLVGIKSARNVVPVPAHWSLKREYLSSKRGIEKPPYQLPQFIVETGIVEMRDAVHEKQAEASLKQKQRERVQPKMGRMDVDYQKLYEAFHRRQTKPTLTGFGEVYYEGKEFETNLRHLRPGEISDGLREALNMPIGAPPPWLINMQRVGLPPSYPALKIPGLNAPPPPGQSWGLHPGGYGKPPVDEQNRPLYGGDVFGVGTTEQKEEKDPPVDRSLWGELQPYEESEAEEEEDEEEEDGEDEEQEQDDGGAKRYGAETPYGGTETPGGMASTVPTPFAGTQTQPEEFNIRKDRRGNETETSHHPRSAGTVLGERSIRAEGFFGGERAYDLSGNQQARASNMPVLGSERDERNKKRKVGDLDVSIDVDALQRDDRMTRDQISKQYEDQRTQQGAGGWQGGVDHEDLSGMVAEEGAKRQKRDRERERDRRGKR